MSEVTSDPSGIEQKFNINDVLKKVYTKVKQHPKARSCEVIYSMGKTVPRMFRGKVLSLETYLVDILQFVAQHIQGQEIPVEIIGPNEFVYTEDVVFKIKDVDLMKSDVAILSRSVEKDGESLGARIEYDFQTRELFITIPFTLAELGFRRHYRLPSKSLLQKSVLILAESQNITMSITNMFKYFPYNVDMGVERFNTTKYDLSPYDLIVIEDKMVNDAFIMVCKELQASKGTKVVVLGKTESTGIAGKLDVAASLVKPVTQESIFELIVSVFSDQYDSEEFLEKRKKLKEAEALAEEERNKRAEASQKSAKLASEGETFESIVEQKRNEYAAVLDTHIGRKNTKSLHLDYEDELEKFYDTFEGSDLYFRQIVNEKELDQIQDFGQNLEKYSQLIGAQSMQKFAETLNLIFQYEKYDVLPIYPGRYHLELKKLFKEIEHYFRGY